MRCPRRCAAGVPHAFGGAIALAYCTEEPRGTRDVDINAFVPADQPEPVLAALPSGGRVPASTPRTLAADGQVRLWWDDTPVDLFLDYAPLHAEAARGSRGASSPWSAQTTRGSAGGTPPWRPDQGGSSASWPRTEPGVCRGSRGRRA